MIYIEEFEEKNGVAMGTQKQKHNQLFNYIKPELQIILKQALTFSSMAHKNKNEFLIR